MTGGKRWVLPIIPLSWGCGHWGAGAALAVIGTQFMLFMTDYVGMAPAAAGAILAFAKLSDVLSDIAVGFLSDRIDTRWGRRRPWVLAGAVLLGLGLVGIFSTDLATPGWAAAAAIGAVLVLYLGYTCVHIPLVAMSAEIATGYKEGGSLWAYGMFFSMLGTTTGTALTPLLLMLYGGGAPAYHGMSWTMGGIALATGLICVFGTAKAPRVPPKAKERLRLSVWIASLISNTPLVAYTAFTTISQLATSIIGISMTFYLFNILKAGQPGMIVYGSAGMPGSVIGLVTFLWLMKRMPKHILAGAAAFLMGLLVLGLRLLDESTPLWLFGVIVFVWGFLVMGTNYMGFSLVPDIIRSDTLKTGMRREGAIASLSAAIQKTMPAFGTLAFGVLLSAGGYISGKGVVQQPESAIDMIYMSTSIIPGCLLLISSVAMFFFYHLTEASLAAQEAQAREAGLT